MKKLGTIIGIGALLATVVPAFGAMTLKGAGNVVLTRTRSSATANTGGNTQTIREVEAEGKKGTAMVVDSGIWSGDAGAASKANTAVLMQGNRIGCCEQPTCCQQPTCGCGSGVTAKVGLNVVAASTVSSATANSGNNSQTIGEVEAEGKKGTAVVSGAYVQSGNAGAASEANTVVGAQVNGLN